MSCIDYRSAVLCSGGLDSTVLLAQEVAHGGIVTPIHINVGFAWEPAEARALQRLLSLAPFAGKVSPLVTLRMDVGALYPDDHWAMAGRPPGPDTPDSAVFLDGRNLLLISQAAVWCSRHGISRLLIGSLKGNPFPDATADFFAAVSHTVGLALQMPFVVSAPLLTRTKRDVVALGRALGVPLALSVSCMNPGADDTHCHRCSKCRERTDALQ